VIFVLTALSAILFWHKSEHDKKFGIAISLFIDNAILNVLRSWLFFTKHMILASVVEMILLLVVTVMLIIAVWPRTKLASYLLMPYALRLMIAAYYATRIYLLN
jgi:translocator protein